MGHSPKLSVFIGCPFRCRPIRLVRGGSCLGPLLQVPCANRGVDVGGAYHPLTALVASEGPGWVGFAVLFHGGVLAAACTVFDGFVYALLVDFASVPAFVHGGVLRRGLVVR